MFYNIDTRLETPPETETTSSIGLEVGADEAVAAEAPVVDTAVKEEVIYIFVV
jgi:hypothetical protein